MKHISNPALLVVFAAMTGCATSQQSDLEYQDYANDISYNLVFSTERLHRLRIGEVDSVKSSYEFDLAFGVKSLYEVLDTDQLTEERKERIYGQIRLISVMHEKYPVPAWAEDEELMDIFSNAQSLDIEQVKEMRCRDWSQPMWIGESKCPCNKQGLGKASQPPKP